MRLLFVFIAGIIIGASLLKCTKYDMPDVIWIVGAFMAVLCSAGTILFSGALVAESIQSDELRAEMVQRYNSLTNLSERATYWEEDSYGKAVICLKVQDWNSTIAKMKAMRENEWYGAIVPSVYDDLEYIDFP